MQHIFLADVHLGAFPDDVNDELENDLCTLIRYCGSHQIRIHILGDLFDYWMEYPGVVPGLGEKILSQFREYNQLHPATYITGNHDNWTRGHFKEAGFLVREDFHTLPAGDKQVFLHHGDGMGKSEFELARPFFHRLLRNNHFVKLYQSIYSPEAGLDLMKRFSEHSKAASTANPEKLNTWSESFLKKHPYDVVICGHDHIPRMETFSGGIYINVGAFYSYRTAARYNKDGFDLVMWDGQQMQFKPANSV